MWAKITLRQTLNLLLFIVVLNMTVNCKKKKKTETLKHTLVNVIFTTALSFIFVIHTVDYCPDLLKSAFSYEQAASTSDIITGEIVV